MTPKETIAPGPPLTVRQAAAEVVAEQARELDQHGRRARKGRDPEEVHQTRVATRRLRAALRVFRDHLAVRARIRRGLKRLARRLGAVRDCDVLIALAETRHLSGTRGDERARLSALVEKWRRSRTEAQARLARLLGGDRHQALLVALRRFAERPRVIGDEDALAGRVLEAAVERQAALLAGHPAMVAPGPTPEQLHDLRIAFKRLRYTLDFHAAACGLAYEVERRMARQMQDVLGEIHDRDLLLDRLSAGRGAYRGPWPTLVGRLAAERQSLARRFLRLRHRWLERTREPAAGEPDATRYATLEPAPVALRLIAGGKT